MQSCELHLAAKPVPVWFPETAAGKQRDLKDLRLTAECYALLVVLRDSREREDNRQTPILSVTVLAHWA